jgi:predicted regulator of Ras-like GTPase activity (Roadblock/LC7/MglB family)
MSLNRQLQQILGVRGVTGAANVDPDGQIIEGVAQDGFDLGFIGNVVASSLASGNLLTELLGEGQGRQMMIEYENGPVLVTPLTDAGAGFVAVLTLDTAATLGRVRLQLRRMLPELIARLG